MSPLPWRLPRWRFTEDLDTPIARARSSALAPGIMYSREIAAFISTLLLPGLISGYHAGVKPGFNKMDADFRRCYLGGPAITSGLLSPRVPGDGRPDSAGLVASPEGK